MKSSGVFRVAPIFLFSLAFSATSASCTAYAEGTVASVRLGLAKFTKTDSNEVVANQSTAYSFEITQYLRLDRAIFFGYRNFSDPVSKRDAYQAAMAGFRYFPFSIGRPVEEAVQETHVTFDSLLKFYLDGGLTLGRCLFKLTTNGAGDLSADTNGVLMGTGLAFFPATNITLDLSASFEYFQSRGGQEGSLGISGSNIYALGGIGLMF